MKTSGAQDLAQKLIVHAARRAPCSLSERLEEEWLADLSSRTSAGSRLRLAIGCYWATGVITRDFKVPQLAGSGMSSAAKPLLGDLSYHLPLLSRRTLAFIVIAGVHGVIIYGIATGLAQHVIATVPQLALGVVIDTVTPPRPAPPPLPFAPPTIPGLVPKVPPSIPGVDLTYTSADEDGTKDKSGAGPGQPPVAPVAPVNRVVGGPSASFPATDDYYPSLARRLSQTGVAAVQVCVDTKGRLTSVPALTKSSGHSSLDEGALRLARAGSGHYRPTTENGQPVNSCYGYVIDFQLN